MGRKAKVKKKYSKKDEDFVRKWYGRKSLERIAKSLGRTLRSVRIKTAMMGLREKELDRWSPEELKTLRFFWGQMKSEEVAEMLPGRSLLAIRQKASKLRLDKSKKVSEDGRYTFRRSKEIYWTADRLRTLRELFPVTSNPEVAEILGISESSMHRKVRELGLKKDQRWIDEKNHRGQLMAKLVNSTRGNSGQWQYRKRIKEKG